MALSKKIVHAITLSCLAGTVSLSASGQESSPSLSADEPCPDNCFCYQAEDHTRYTICTERFNGLRSEITYTNSAGQQVTLQASYFSHGYLWNLQSDVIENPFTISRVCFDTVENCLSHDYSPESRDFFARAQEKWDELFHAENIGQRYVDFAQQERARRFSERQLE